MDELKKVYDELQNWMAEEEKKHETSIDDFINLDDEVKKDFMGDWTEREVENYLYVLHRASVCSEAIEILKEERIGK